MRDQSEAAPESTRSPSARCRISGLVDQHLYFSSKDAIELLLDAFGLPFWGLACGTIGFARCHQDLPLTPRG